MKQRRRFRVKTLLQARAFILSVGSCLLFADSKKGLPTLWDATDLSDKKPMGGWSPRIIAIWNWKNELPAQFPDEIFYGKFPGGLAMLMSMDHLRQIHYPKAHLELARCTPLARRLYELIRREPRTTTELRHALLNPGTITRAMIDRALTELQTTLNITRSNAPEIERDTWLRFTEQYPDFS